MAVTRSGSRARAGRTAAVRRRAPRSPAGAADATTSSSDDEDVDNDGGGGDTAAVSSPDRTRFLGAFFVLACALLYTLFANFPPMSAADVAVLRLPRSTDDLRQLHGMLARYRDAHFWAVYAGFCTVYIFLQVFAIPGAIFLSILAGPLFGVWRGLLTVSAVATTGASMCFLLSHAVGHRIVHRCFPDLLASFRARVHSHRHNLFWYMLFLRVSPLLPNWFISISSPHLNVPLRDFFFATLIGLMPANWIHVNTGIALEQLNMVNPRSFLTLLALALLALIPTMFRKRLETMDDEAGAGGKVRRRRRRRGS